MKFALPESRRSRRSRLRRWSASGWMTPGLIGILALGLALGSYEHGHGNIHRLKETVGIQPQTVAHIVGPGGQDPIQLVRHISENGNVPEFVGATLLPGRGFNLWQITAFLPGHGDVPLLVAPDAINNVLSATGTDADGSMASKFGGAFLAPWAAQLAGFPSPANNVLQTQWQGQRLTFPASAPGSSLSTEGFLLSRGADSVKTSIIPDGQSAQATFHAGTFAGSWASNTDLTILVELTGRTLDLTVTAQNVGNAPEPFGIGWHPYFAIPSGNRANATLVIPSSDRISPPDRRTGLSNGTLIPTQNTPYDFTKASGTPLRDLSLDETYLNLHAGLLADGPIAELQDPAVNYGLRIIPLSSNIRNLHVVAPLSKPWVSIGPNMNLPDPFGSEWDHLDTTGMVVLQPGDSVQWKVQIEIFSLTHSIASGRQ